MRAKLRLIAVNPIYSGAETLSFMAVGPNSSYPHDGSDDNNSYALWTPSAELKMTVNNPNLIGKFKVGEEFYVDFTPVNPPDTGVPGA